MAVGGRRARGLGKRVMRSLLGPNSQVERRLRRRRRVGAVRREDRQGYRVTRNDKLLVIDPDRPAGDPLGIYLWGGCDLPTLFGLGPHIGPTTRRRVVLYQGTGEIDRARADFLLQTLQDLSAGAVEETILRMRLRKTHFAPVLFEPTFDTGVRGVGTLPKSVVALTGAANFIRVAYRHKETGLLIDPGARWLRSDDRIPSDDIEWFKDNYERVGRLSVDQFVEDFARLVAEIKQRTGAAVLAFNALTVEPGSRDHNYQLRRSPEGMRRLEFSVAMAELAPIAGFHVVDVDGALKRAGVRESLDFAHFPSSAVEPIAAEATAVLTDAGLLDG